jgi:hypothetical protein
VGLSREELIEKITKAPPIRALDPLSPSKSPLAEVSPQPDSDADSLEAFQPMPPNATESSTYSPSQTFSGVQDDVNALSLSVRTTSSYLGISSVMAVLRVIAWLDPEMQNIFTKSPNISAAPSRAVTSPSTPVEYEDFALHYDSGPPASAWEEIPFINAYFTFVHPFAPMIDETTFRNTYLSQKRSDSQWLLLLNVVLALGSAMDNPLEDKDHLKYYMRAQRYLTIESLGSAHLETVQALTLLGGLYLHYLQLPNQANALMGAALRLATALGLHRDYSESTTLAKNENMTSLTEHRHRVWWSLFCLDAWACSNLGRPSMGRMGHAISAKMPQQMIVGSVTDASRYQC